MFLNVLIKYVLYFVSNINNINFYRYLVCELQKNRGQFCPSTASVSIDQRDNRIVLRRPHDHEPREINLHVPFLREAIGEGGIDQTVSTTFTRTLYNNEIVK